MKQGTMNLLLVFALAIAVSLAMSAAPALAQRGGGVKTDSRILYHNGAVLHGTSNVYFIWYGNWDGNITPSILTDLAINLGASPYFLINTAYPDSTGAAPSGSLIYGGAIYDRYSHGPTLTVSDIQGIVIDAIEAGRLALDPAGIYIVLASADVTDIRSDGTSFCTPSARSLHGTSLFNGSQFRYAFIGNAMRCPTTAAPQFIAPGGGMLPGPNGDLGGDAMASTMAHALAVIVTNPTGTGWFDRYGLENAAKCQGTFGTTYTSAYGGPTNIRLGQRDFMLQQNWVNTGRKGYCGLSNP